MMETMNRKKIIEILRKGTYVPTVMDQDYLKPSSYKWDGDKAPGYFIQTYVQADETINTLEAALNEKDTVRGKYAVALREIESMGGKTLLGRCCVEKRCTPSDSGASCELQEKTNTAFNEAAGVATMALK